MLVFSLFIEWTGRDFRKIEEFGKELYRGVGENFNFGEEG